MKPIEKLSGEKGTRVVLLVCCVLVTIAFLFNVADSHIQRKRIENEIRGIDTWGIERNLEGINSELKDISRELTSISDELNSIEYEIKWR